MRETLKALATGDLSVEEAESELAGYATGEAGRFDAARESRRGVPEAILAEGKTDAEVASLIALALETTDRAIVTRLENTDGIRKRLDESASEASFAYDERARTLRVHAEGYEANDLEATVAVVTAGTADAAVAGEATAIVEEMGATVERVSDVGVAGVHRLVDRLGELREADVIVVAAGREGALPTVLAGLVDVPVIGVPVSTGYGYGGDGRGAFSGLAQSCTVLSFVNIDAGFTAGAQAGLIARAVDGARG